MNDLLDVNESEANISSTNYTFWLTKDEIERLEKIRERNEHLLKKQKNARSSIIKLIVENTYLYLNNSERNFMNDLEKIINKEYYNDIDMDFLRRIASVETTKNKKIKRIKTDNKEYDLILELVRNQLLRIISTNYSEDKLEKVQLRLAKDDEKMLRIIAGNRSLSLNDFLSGYIRYFLSFPPMTQNYILDYPKILKIERAIRECKIVEINNIRYKPIKFIKSSFSRMEKTLICFDAACDSFCEIELMRYGGGGFISRDVEFTEEDFVINSYEKDVLDLYNKLDVIDVSFLLIKNEGYNIKKFVDEDHRLYLAIERMLERKHDGNKYYIKLKYDKYLIKSLLRENKKTIDYLCFSDNYNDFIKLIEPKSKAFDKYQRELRTLEREE